MSSGVIRLRKVKKSSVFQLMKRVNLQGNGLRDFLKKERENYFIMIKEFALDPRTIASWKDARYLLEKFGFPNGRMICRLPKDKESAQNWEQMVLESISLPKDRSRVFSKLKL